MSYIAYMYVVIYYIPTRSYVIHGNELLFERFHLMLVTFHVRFSVSWQAS